MLDDGAYKYIYGLGRIAEVSGSSTSYYLTDAQGSVMALCDASGTVLNSYNYDVFGAIRSSSGSTANAFTFTGEQTDATTGLEYLRARYYDSEAGRFLSTDPLGGGYAYAANSPTNMTDPSGLSPCINASENPYHSAARRAWWDRMYADNFCGGDGMFCGWTTDCSQGRGFEPETECKPSPCMTDEERAEQVAIAKAIYYAQQADNKAAEKAKCEKSLLTKAGCFLNTPCGGLVGSVITTALGAIPGSHVLAKTGLATGAVGGAFQGGLAAGTGDEAGAAANALSAIGDALAVTGAGGVILSLATSGPSVVVSGYHCRKG